jgi:hypothetical protein
MAAACDVLDAMAEETSDKLVVTVTVTSDVGSMADPWAVVEQLQLDNEDVDGLTVELGKPRHY